MKGDKMEKRLNALLRLAISHHATDIHFTLYQNEMVIEMRINNAIRKVKIQNGDDKLIKYLQYLSNLDIGNIKIPQTGQFEWYIDGKTLSLRFALINTQSMINGVLRILNEDLDINLNNLSYKESDREFFKKMLKKPNGLFLISGPTGCNLIQRVITQKNSTDVMLKLSSIEIDFINDCQNKRFSAFSSVLYKSSIFVFNIPLTWLKSLEIG